MKMWRISMILRLNMMICQRKWKKQNPKVHQKRKKLVMKRSNHPLLKDLLNFKLHQLQKRLLQLTTVNTHCKNRQCLTKVDLTNRTIWDWKQKVLLFKNRMGNPPNYHQDRKINLNKLNDDLHLTCLYIRKSLHFALG